MDEILNQLAIELIYQGKDLQEIEQILEQEAAMRGMPVPNLHEVPHRGKKNDRLRMIEDRDRRIYELRMQGKSNAEVAEEFGLTRQAISLITIKYTERNGLDSPVMVRRIRGESLEEKWRWYESKREERRQKLISSSKNYAREFYLDAELSREIPV